jgi:hypothetical protein
MRIYLSVAFALDFMYDTKTTMALTIVSLITIILYERDIPIFSKTSYLSGSGVVVVVAMFAKQGDE